MIIDHTGFLNEREQLIVNAAIDMAVKNVDLAVALECGDTASIQVAEDSRTATMRIFAEAVATVFDRSRESGFVDSLFDDIKKEMG